MVFCYLFLRLFLVLIGIWPLLLYLFLCAACVFICICVLILCSWIWFFLLEIVVVVLFDRYYVYCSSLRDAVFVLEFISWSWLMMLIVFLVVLFWSLYFIVDLWFSCWTCVFFVCVVICDLNSWLLFWWVGFLVVLSSSLLLVFLVPCSWIWLKMLLMSFRPLSMWVFFVPWSCFSCLIYFGVLMLFIVCFFVFEFVISSARWFLCWNFLCLFWCVVWIIDSIPCSLFLNLVVRIESVIGVRVDPY